MPKYVNEHVTEGFRWMDTLAQLEGLLAKLETDNPDTSKLEDVIITMKFKDFQAFIDGIRKLVIHGLPSSMRRM